MSRYDYTVYNKKKRTDTGKTQFVKKRHTTFTPHESFVKRMEAEFTSGIFTVNQDWKEQLPLIYNSASMNPKLLAACYDIYAKTNFDFLDSKNKKDFDIVMERLREHFSPPLKKYEQMNLTDLKREADSNSSDKDELVKMLRESDVRFFKLKQDALVYMLALKRVIRGRVIQEDKEESSPEPTPSEDSDSESELTREEKEESEHSTL